MHSSELNMFKFIFLKWPEHFSEGGLRLERGEGVGGYVTFSSTEEGLRELPQKTFKQLTLWLTFSHILIQIVNVNVTVSGLQQQQMTNSLKLKVFFADRCAHDVSAVSWKTFSP